MNITIHQLNFIPYIGFFEKLIVSDKLIVLDNVQYSKGNWHNRNRIKTVMGPQWISVPVNVKLGQKINEVTIASKIKLEQIWKTIEYNYCKSKYFSLYKEGLYEIFHQNYEKLVDINYSLLLFITKAMSIDTEIIFASDIVDEELNLTKTDLLLYICEKEGAKTYLSGIGGREYLEVQKFDKKNITVVFQDFSHPTYNQLYKSIGFIENLSIIDLLFNEGVNSKKIIEKNANYKLKLL